MDQWACEELNLGPHAYQACDASPFSRQLRAVSHVPAARATPKRTRIAPKIGTGSGARPDPDSHARRAFARAAVVALAPLLAARYAPHSAEPAKHAALPRAAVGVAA